MGVKIAMSIAEQARIIFTHMHEKILILYESNLGRANDNPERFHC